MTRESEAERAARYQRLEESYPVIDSESYEVRSRRSILAGSAGVVAAVLGWRWIQQSPDADNIPQPLRKTLEANQGIWRRLFRQGHQAPTFDRTESSFLRVNGRHGIDQEIDLDSWQFEVLDDSDTLGTYNLKDLQTLPAVEMTVEHKCIEGWSHIVTWGGARFSDFVETYHPSVAADPPEYVSVATPNGRYYVGLDWASMVHPQTLLCHSLQGQPLSIDHGAPLRLTSPVKYGIKQLKQIGTIKFTKDRPRDYWAERGYDWYSGL